MNKPIDITLMMFEMNDCEEHMTNNRLDCNNERENEKIN